MFLRIVSICISKICGHYNITLNKSDIYAHMSTVIKECRPKEKCIKRSICKTQGQTQ